MATVLQGRTAEEGDVIGDGGPAFAEVFVIVWLGSLVVTLNTKLLGGHISFFQSVCVLGKDFSSMLSEPSNGTPK
jgi:hypothetical protein